MNRYKINQQHSIATIKPIRFGLVWLITGLLMAPQLWAQIEDETPNSDTEIICYAAQKQWVCAPADEKHKAHAKAMRLQQEAPVDGNQTDSQVAISTLDSNNEFIQQVQEQTPVQDSINEFTARRESPQATEKQGTLTVDVELMPATGEQAADQIDGAVAKPVTEIQQVSHDDSEFSDWLSKHPDQWTFQVVGSSNQHQLAGFIEQHQLQLGQYAIAKTQVNGADWWVVLVGRYDSRDQAINQRNQLPDALASQAWVRQIKTIKP